MRKPPAILALASVLLLATSGSSPEECADSNDDASSLLQSSKSSLTAAETKADLKPAHKHSAVQSHIQHKAAKLSTDVKVASSDAEPSAISKYGTVEHHLENELELVSTEAKANATLAERVVNEIKFELNVLANATLSDRIVNEIEFELNSPDDAGPMRNKLILVLIEAFMLPACCGIDRCYMGQPIMGVVKGVTFGGVGIWAMIDFWVVLVNAARESTSINAFGFHGQFLGSEAGTSKYLSYLMISVMICCGFFGVIGTLLGAAKVWVQAKLDTDTDPKRLADDLVGRHSSINFDQ